MENSLDRPGSLSTVLPKEQTRHGSRGWKRPLDRGKVSVGQPINLWQKLWLTEVSLNRLASSDLGPSVFVVLCCSIAWVGTRETTGDGTGSRLERERPQDRGTTWSSGSDHFLVKHHSRSEASHSIQVVKHGLCTSPSSGSLTDMIRCKLRVR